DVVERVKRLFGRSAILDRLLPVFANSGIRHRYSTVPLDWYDEPHGWKERNGRYIAGALDLLDTVAGRAPDEAGVGIAVPRRRGDRAKSNIVATALFGDGAAAVLLRCGAEGPAIVATGEHTWPNSLDIMGWEVAEDGLKAVFSRDIPRLIETELRPATDAFL